MTNAVVEMYLTDCWCSLPFSMPKRLYDKCKGDGSTFYCPLGHAIVFKTSDADKFRREAERLKQENARLEQSAKDALDAANNQYEQRQKAEKALKNHKKRASAGTCPCCNRTFSNMSTHLKHKHPDFVKDQGANVVTLKKKSHA